MCFAHIIWRYVTGRAWFDNCFKLVSSTARECYSDEVSRHTIGRRLEQMGIKCRRSCKNKFIFDINSVERLLYATYALTKTTANFNLEAVKYFLEISFWRYSYFLDWRDKRKTTMKLRDSSILMEPTPNFIAENVDFNFDDPCGFLQSWAYSIICKLAKKNCLLR